MRKNNLHTMHSMVAVWLLCVAVLSFKCDTSSTSEWDFEPSIQHAVSGTHPSVVSSGYSSHLYGVRPMGL